MTTNELIHILRRFALPVPDKDMDARIIAAIGRAAHCPASGHAEARASRVRWAFLCPALIAAGVAVVLLLSPRAGCQRATPRPCHEGTSAFFESVCTTTTHGALLEQPPHVARPVSPAAEGTMSREQYALAMPVPCATDNLMHCNLWSTTCHKG